MRKFALIVLSFVVGFQVMASDTLKVVKNQPTGVTKAKVTNLGDVITSDFYPVELRQQGIEGEVLVDVWISDKGQVVKYEIIEASHEMLEKLVISHIALLEFEPAKNAQGISINSISKLPFQFNLDID